jgi:hypothetical protein
MLCRFRTASHHIKPPGKFIVVHGEHLQGLKKISQSFVFRMDKARSIRGAVWDGYPIRKNRLDNKMVISADSLKLFVRARFAESVEESKYVHYNC